MGWIYGAFIETIVVSIMYQVGKQLILPFINEGGKDEYGGTLNTGIIFGVKFGGKVD